MSRKKALLYLVIAGILWSIGGLFIKLVDWNTMAIAGARSGIGAIVMIIYLRQPIKIHGKFKLLGVLSYASLLVLFVTANKLTTSANAILLQFTSPIWVALFGNWFLKEKTLLSDWITIIFVMFGMTLFFIGDIGNGNTIGNIISVISGISMALVIIFIKLQKEGSPIEVTILGNILVFLIGLPFFFSSVPNIKSIIALLILGIFQIGISYIFYTLSIKHVTAIEAILIPIIEPLLNPLWVFLFTGESPAIYAFLGGLIIIVSIIGRGVFQHRNKAPIIQKLIN